MDDAEARFRLALEYQPRFSEPHQNLGLVALSRGDLEEAEAHLRAATRLNEDFAEAWSNLGIVYERMSRNDDARGAYDRALSINPGLINARRNISRLLVSRRAFGPARAHLMRLVQLVPNDPQAEGLLAYVELRIERPAEAERRATRLLATHPENAVGLTVRGIILAQRGELERAKHDLQRASADPLVGYDARLRLAAVTVAGGELERARPLVSSLLVEGAEDAAVQLVAGYLELALGHVDAARAYAEDALRLAPDLAAARSLIERIDG